MDKYDLILADVPWTFNNKNTGGSMKSGADSQYDVMTLDDIKNMPIESIAAKDCVLVFWWIGAMPKEAIEVVEAWGFKLKNMNGFVWRKLTVKGKSFFGMGYYTRAGSESAIIAVRGKPKIKDRGVRAVFSARVGRHSEKPKKMIKNCERLIGKTAKKLELFGRGKAKKGWDIFGNQAFPSIVMEENEFRQPTEQEIYEQILRGQING